MHTVIEINQEFYLYSAHYKRGNEGIGLSNIELAAPRRERVTPNAAEYARLLPQRDFSYPAATSQQTRTRSVASDQPVCGGLSG